MNQFNNGTHPLTSAQQAQLDATKQQFDQLIAQQEITNANYENGMRILNNTTGVSEYFPGIAMGQVQTAINSGLQQVADLNSKESSALATMQEGFETDNFKMVTDSYAILQKIDEDKKVQIKCASENTETPNMDKFTNTSRII